MSNNPFKEAENNGRDIALNIFNREILPAGYKAVEGEDKRVYDLYIMKDDKPVALVEIKKRNCDSSTYSNSILTDNKYKNLLNKKLPVYFIAIYNDDKYYIWNLRKVNPYIEHHYCKNITVIPESGRRFKDCYCFNFEDAQYTGTYKNLL